MQKKEIATITGTITVNHHYYYVTFKFCGKLTRIKMINKQVL